MKIQKELDETKIVLHKTIESVLQRGEKIDDLVAKSDGLSAQSKMFYSESPLSGVWGLFGRGTDSIQLKRRSRTRVAWSCRWSKGRNGFQAFYLFYTWQHCRTSDCKWVSRFRQIMRDFGIERSILQAQNTCDKPFISVSDVVQKAIYFSNGPTGGI